MDAAVRVVGVDPGLTRMGFGVVEASAGRLALLTAGTLRTSPGATPPRLKSIFSELSRIIGDWSPTAMAVERVFLKVNLRTGVPAIQAGGIAMLAGASADLEVTEYSAAQVKQTITGVGNASKDQVRFMVQRLLGVQVAADSPDAADALAVAITHLHSRTDRYGALPRGVAAKVAQ